MYQFSLDQSVEKINNPATRDMFKEVLSSYYNNNYRSASVMLWTVIICDLVFKIKELKDLYQDIKAKAVYDEIVQLQKNKPTDPHWEKILLSQVAKKMALYTNIELDELSQIQKRRNLSAHPILDQNDVLFHPNRESVLADLRNAVEIVLSKPAIFSRNITEELLNDIALIKDLIKDNNSLEKYLNSKYFNNLSDLVCIHTFRETLHKSLVCVNGVSPA